MLRGYDHRLDGLRAIAVLLVLAFHFGQSSNPFAAGWMGVDLFFALSGYLITTLLLTEREKTGAVNYRFFLARRGLRLLPALVVMLAIMLILSALGVPFRTKAGVEVSTAEVGGWVAAALAYIINWLQAFGAIVPRSFSHQWSLAVEEQFYFVWPLVVIWAARRRDMSRTVLRVAAAAAAVSAVLSVALVFTSHRQFVYYSTPTRAGEILAGAALAAALHIRPPQPGWSQRGRGRILALAGPGILALVLLTRTPAHEFGRVAPFLFVGSVITVAATLDARGAAATLLCNRYLGWVGRRSYAIYLWHVPVYALVISLAGHWRVPLALAGTFLIAEASHRLVERPAMAHRHRFVPGSGRARPADPSTGVGGTSPDLV